MFLFDKTTRAGAGVSRRRTTVRSIAAGASAAMFLTLMQVPSQATEPQPTGASTTLAAPSAETSAEQDEIDATARLARDSGRRVEVDGLASATSTTYMEPSGLMTVEMTEEPTRVERDGDWVPIRTELSDTGSVLEAASIGADVAIGDGIGDEPLATIEQDGKSLSLDWPRDLDAPAVEGAAATFQDTASRDVQVTATANGFNVHVVLDKAPTTAPVYRLPIGAKGLRVEKTHTGQFVAVDTQTGEPLFWIRKPVGWDNTQQGLEAGPEVTVDVDAQLEEGADGGQVLVLRPDYEWLKADTTVYPVRIDPDVYTDTNSTRSTYVASSSTNPTNSAVKYNRTNFGTSSMLRTGWYSSEYGATRTYLEWDDVARPGTVVKADLRLYQYDAQTCTPSTLSIYPVTQEWWSGDHPTQTGPKAGVTWSASSDGKGGQPSIDWDTDYETSKSFVHGSDDTCGLGPDGRDRGLNGHETIPVTDLVKAWDEGYPNHGMVLRAAETSGNSTAYKGFCSRNYNTTASATSCYDGQNPPPRQRPAHLH